MVRHVSRTHRVAFHWLFDRINLDPKIQIKYVDTKNQLADMLTTGIFTRDEWSHVLRLFHITNFSMFSCSHFPWNIKQSTISKRAQERGTEEGPAVGKPRSACLVSGNLLSARQTSSSDSGASHVLGSQELRRISVSRSTGTPARDRVQNLATNSQEWRKDDNPFRGTVKPVRSGVCVCERPSTRKPVRGVENQLARTRLVYHKIQISHYRYVDKVFENLRQKLSPMETQ